MGYYSDVGIALSKKGVDTLKKAMTDKTLDAGLCHEIEELLDFREVHTVADNGDELWVWGDIKWYDFEFEEIGWLMERLDELDEDDYYYVRAGEEYDDNEVKGCHWDNPFSMALVRTINYEEPQAA